MTWPDAADVLVVTGVLLIAAGFFMLAAPATLFWLGGVLMAAGLLKARRSG